MPNFTLSELDNLSSIGSFVIALLTAFVAGALWLRRRKLRNGESPAEPDVGRGRRGRTEPCSKGSEAKVESLAVPVGPVAFAFAAAEVLHHHADNEQRRNLAVGFDKAVSDGGINLENLDVSGTKDAAASIADGLLDAGEVVGRIVEGS